ncbi:MAG: TatD family hydrolase, partial [Treponema sp.]|nr:TatD family hydrolase [Treponema sp.]
MFTDAHCHPFDLARILPAAEEDRRRLGVISAASSTTREEFEYNEALAVKARAEDAPLLLPCFAVHPQLPAALKGEDAGNDLRFSAHLEFLETLAREGRLAAVGETGFDLYNASFRETEAVQDELFAAHLEIALRYDLPLVLHVRRAMHKIFAHKKNLKKCRSVIFHSWPGTAGEGTSLLKSGINVYFSFGAVIGLNHKEAIRCCTVFPQEHLLTETDAPYQSLRGKAFSCWGDLPAILKTAA